MLQCNCVKKYFAPPTKSPLFSVETFRFTAGTRPSGSLKEKDVSNYNITVNINKDDKHRRCQQLYITAHAYSGLVMQWKV